MDDVVTIAWTDPAWLTERHGIDDRGDVIARIRGALEGHAATAAGGGEDEDE